jgi:hypothetical protein
MVGELPRLRCTGYQPEPLADGIRFEQGDFTCACLDTSLGPLSATALASPESSTGAIADVVLDAQNR